MPAPAPPTTYGPHQLREKTGLHQWQIERALADGVIPPCDRARGWSAPLVDDITGRIEEIRALIGSVPDGGAGHAAYVLTERLGVTVTSDAVRELAARGLLPQVGEFKGHPVYCGRTLEKFTDVAVVQDAARDGELLTADQTADRMRIRRTDVDHLIRAGLMTVARWGRSGWRPRSHAPDVALYRAGDIAALLARDDIDWDAARAVAAGARSPFAQLPDAAGAGR